MPISRPGTVGLSLLVLLGACVAPRPVRVAVLSSPRDSAMLASLREKEQADWTGEDWRWAMGHRDAFYPVQVVEAGKARPLPVGPALEAFAAGTPGGAEFERYVADQRITGILVLQDGRIRLEWYPPDRTPQDRWTSESVAKSVTSTLVGFALHDGAIRSLDDTVSRYLPALRGSAYDAVTVRQALTMTSGVRWQEDYTTGTSDLAKLYQTTPEPGMSMATTYMRTRPREFPPGERFVYKTGESHLIGDLVRAATGRTLSEYLSEKLWKPYGMESPATWTIGPAGAEFAGCCLQVTLRDYGRFGQFALDGGRIGGVQAVDDGWFADATSAHVTLNDAGYGYGYQWWTAPGGLFRADGIHGQLIDIDPARRLVIVLNSAWPEATSRERAAVRNQFVGKVKAALDAESRQR